MKKVIMIMFFIALSVVLVHGYADAKVTGTCSTCHTMHNSQDNAPMTYDSTATPQEKLLRGGCIGCHAQNTSANIIDSVLPQVWHSNGTDLAGGNFAGVVSSQANGHNVTGGITGIIADTTNTTPPGYAAAYDPNGSSFTSSNLVCAGTSGCHGDRSETNEFTAVSGAHHGDDSILKYGTDFTLTGQGVSATTSYRMLKGVKGAEDDDWQATVGAQDHNGYYAKIYGARTTQGTEGDTISELCAQCHGAFHMSGLNGSNEGISTASPWVRHPTDVVIPAGTTEYAGISTTYQDETPVGRPVAHFVNDLAKTATGTVTAGTDIVICMSCHRAHGTDNPDALRFSYTTQIAGQGCLHCHTGKDPFSP